MRALRGDKVVPVVELDAKPMKTQYGTKLRPEFKIVDWRDFGGETAPAVPTTPVAPQIGKPVEPVTSAEEFDDEIPPF